MNCGCVYIDGGESPTFASARVGASRRERRCGECGQPIQVGDRYERVWGVWEGVGETFITCATCLEISTALFCSGRMHGTMWEDLKEAFAYSDTIPWATIGELSKAARDAICDWIESDLWDDTDEEDGCPGCAEGEKPVLLDKHGTLASISGLPGHPGHAVNDEWWYCEDYA